MDSGIPENWKSAFKIICVIILLIVVFSLAAPTSSGAKAVVESLGYTNVTVSEIQPAWYLCGEDDYYRFEVTATSPNGTPVNNIYVCAGIAKGYTVRYHK